MDGYKIVSAADFVPDKLRFKEKWYNPKGESPKVCTNYMSLDTETSKTSEIGWVYQWAFSYPDRKGNRSLVYGRKPSDLARALAKIIVENGLNENKKLIVFVHNLSYDYTYISRFIEKELQERGVLLAIAAHKLITYMVKGLEFRDSLKVAQKSLAKWGKELGIKHQKLVGEIDYNTRRFQQSQLFKKDWRYMFRDVVSLDECIEKQMSKWGDNTLSMPLTNTGYVRRATREYFRGRNLSDPKEQKKVGDFNRRHFKETALNLDTYNYCRMEFAGGITHGNRFYSGVTVRLDELIRKHGKNTRIRHRDFVSHYPSQQITKYAPASRFVLAYDRNDQNNKRDISHKDLMGLIGEGKCFLAGIIISNVHLKKGVTLPVLQYSHVQEGAFDHPHYVVDNGRIVDMDGHALIVVNELDLKWIIKQYTFDYEIVKVYTARAGKFPKYITDTVNKFFYDKTYYKMIEKDMEKRGVLKDSAEYIDNHLDLMIAKGMLNAIYGMSATDPVRTAFEEADDGEWSREHLETEDIVNRLAKYYSGRNNFMSYQYGIWTTAHARDELLTFVELIGYEYFLYADTDSIFYISTPEIEEKINALNAAFKEECDLNGWYLDVTWNDQTKRTYYHQFEEEPEEIVSFRFMHSKCYAYETINPDTGKVELNATIAGVREHGLDGMSRVKELGCIDNLDAGHVFKKCGGTRVVYPGKGEDISPRIVNIDGWDTEVSNYALIENTSKTLSACMTRNEYAIEWHLVS